MDMMEALRTASEKVDGGDRFDARQAFGKRVGKHMIFPVGLGSALAKAVREGYLTVIGEGSRRRGRTYQFTSKGREVVF